MSYERLLGRRLTREERGAVATLNDLPADVAREAARIAETSTSAAAMYLKDVVARADLDDALAFVDEVVRGGGDATTWRVADHLCVIDVPVRELLTRDATLLLAPLQTVTGDRWWVLAPTMATWDSSGLGGAPGVIVRRAAYWFDGPERTGHTRIADAEVAPVADLAVALRRWIASRVAWETRRTPVGADSTVASVCERLGVAEAELSEDGRGAVVALIQEAGLPSAPAIPPGFRGPDDWYR